MSPSNGHSALSKAKQLVLPAILLGSLLLGGCSRTVEWEEEVPLNTGETIWVKREVTYTLKGDAGNPIDMAYRPDYKETLRFEWRGKKYSYMGEAGIMLIAISPLAKQPVLVAEATMKGWDDETHYKCTSPFYVQFIPDQLGKSWTWPRSIESWLYELP